MLSFGHICLTNDCQPIVSQTRASLQRKGPETVALDTERDLMHIVYMMLIYELLGQSTGIIYTPDLAVLDILNLHISVMSAQFSAIEAVKKILQGAFRGGYRYLENILMECVLASRINHLSIQVQY